MSNDVLALLPLLAIWATLGTLLAVIDLRTHRLPNLIVFSVYPCVCIALWSAGLSMGQWRWGQACIGAGIWLATFGAIWFVTAGKAMGFGDVKLAPVLGLSLGWCGWEIAVVGLVCAWLLGGIFAAGLILFGRAQRSSVIAFGPFLIGAFWVSLGIGPWMVHGATMGALV